MDDGGNMTEIEAFNRLRERYGATRARQLLGTLRLLTLFGRQAVQRERLMPVSTLYADVKALADVGVGERLEATETLDRFIEVALGWIAPAGASGEVDRALAEPLRTLLAPHADARGIIPAAALGAIEEVVLGVLRAHLRLQLGRLQRDLTPDGHDAPPPDENES